MGVLTEKELRRAGYIGAAGLTAGLLGTMLTNFIALASPGLGAVAGSALTYAVVFFLVGGLLAGQAPQRAAAAGAVLGALVGFISSFSQEKDQASR